MKSCLGEAASSATFLTYRSALDCGNQREQGRGLPTARETFLHVGLHFPVGQLLAFTAVVSSSPGAQPTPASAGVYRVRACLHACT